MTTYWLIGEKSVPQSENNNIQQQVVRTSITSNQIPAISTPRHSIYGGQPPSQPAQSLVTGNGAPPALSPSHHRSNNVTVTSNSTQQQPQQQQVNSETLPNHNVESGANAPLLLPIGSVP